MAGRRQRAAAPWVRQVRGSPSAGKGRHVDRDRDAVPSMAPDGGSTREGVVRASVVWAGAGEREKVEAMLCRIAARPSFFDTLPASWTQNEAFVKGAVRASQGAVLRYVSYSMKSGPAWESLLLEVLAHSMDGVMHATLSQRSSKDFMMRAVRIKGLALRFGSAAVRADADVVLAAVAESASAVRFAHCCLSDDVAFWKRAVEENARVLLYGRLMHERLDRDIVFSAVSKQGWLLQYAHASLRADEEVVRAAVSEGGCGDALKYASSQLRADERTVRLAVIANSDAIQHASDTLWKTVDRRDFARRAALCRHWPQARAVLIGAMKEGDDALCPLSWLARDLIERILDEMASGWP